MDQEQHHIEITRKLKNAREQKKLTQLEVEKLTSINHKTLSGYEIM
ncbi:XRE family transcriptional regulator [Paenibacillus nanensis]|uniref:XRE family transcriptional regulator n=1 Tax=Paenibacillus nanensis TaxID=393251 RepID=A0A3A1VEE7_9BACL|nr:helix-turn-helix transcriptional regulator [Paenibacillus nanensis]RIX59289.1 XRE family transcriptional regulator [Paenibacillus nanensis]